MNLGSPTPEAKPSLRTAPTPPTEEALKRGVVSAEGMVRRKENDIPDTEEVYIQLSKRDMFKREHVWSLCTSSLLKYLCGFIWMMLDLRLDQEADFQGSVRLNLRMSLPANRTRP